MATKKVLNRRSSKKDGKNPYSDRGVDKFSALLAEVEEKKRMIYSQHSPDEVSMIRFVHTSDNKLKPVVLRANNKAYSYKKNYVEEHDPDPAPAPAPAAEHGGDVGVDQEKKVEVGTEKEGSSSPEEELPEVGVQPWYYLLGGMVILVLILMAVYGRYWKSYYLVQLQATICPRIERE